MEYAIVDIETTGGNAATGSITEIAIRIHDGQKVIDSYETLVRPAHSIPPYITQLTGIDDAMVAGHPPFSAIAQDVFALLSNRIFVAHNVGFDYSFVKSHLASAGFAYEAQKLCTIKMSRSLKPGLRSYSLGNLCETLDIGLNARHRAGGDADATAILFSRLLQWDTNDTIPAMLHEPVTGGYDIPTHLRTDFDLLPGTAGIYYFYDDAGTVIYVGKAKDLKKRVAQHFKMRSGKRKTSHFQEKISAISYESCGTELIAFIREALEIKRLVPQHNTALKKYEAKAGLFVYEDEQGYLRMVISRSKKGYEPLQLFTTQQGGVHKLRELVKRFGLCSSLCRLRSCELCEMVPKGKELLCTGNLPPQLYNERVAQALAFLEPDQRAFYIIDRGRNAQEKSCIWVENGQLYGIGYIDNAADMYSMDDVKASLTRYPGNHYITQLIISYVCKYPRKAITLSDSNSDYQIW